MTPAPRGHVTPKGRAVAKRPAPDPPVSGELLPPLLSKEDLRPMIRTARRRAHAAKRANQLLAASLSELQEAEAHRTYGRKSFPEWAVAEFGDFDLTIDSVKNMCRSGRALLFLHREGRIDLSDHRTLPGTTGTRALSAVLSNHGEQAALATFDACPEGHVVATTVNAAAGALLPPPPPTEAPTSSHHEDDDDEPEDEPPEEVQRLQTSIERIRDLLDELYVAEEIDPVAVQRAYKHLLEDTEALGSVLDAVLPVEGEPAI
jgi:hypothetical protein